MPFTRGAREVPTQTPASNSDARKRKAEKDQRTIEVKVDVDTDELREWAGKHADAGQAGVAHVLYATARQLETGSVPAFLDGGESAPPAPSEPWRDISTDRDNPTLAKVTWEPGSPDGLVGQWWLDGDFLCRVGDSAWRVVDHITHVELLHTHDPETHVPVERALIDEAARLVEWWNTDSFDSSPPSDDREILTALAALADGAGS